MMPKEDVLKTLILLVDASTWEQDDIACEDSVMVLMLCRVLVEISSYSGVLKCHLARWFERMVVVIDL